MAAREQKPTKGQTGQEIAPADDSIVRAHRGIEALLEETGDALRFGDAAAAEEAFTRLRDALETHFEQEDRLYFPSIRALRSEWKTRVERLAAGHAGFRADVASIHALLEAGSHDEAQQALDAFVRAFRVHEEAEEEMLRALDREVGARG